MDQVLIVAGLCLAIVLLIAFLWQSRSRKPKIVVSGIAPTRPSGLREHWILGYGGDLQDKAWHIGQRTVTLGRGVGNYVQITDESISRVHCQFAPQNGKMVITDKAGRNSTLVNDNPITTHTLIDGDVIRIGQSALTYRSHGNFGDNEGMGRKEVGARVAKPTQMAGMQTVRDVLLTALREHQGNTKQAASSLGMRHELFLNSIQAQNINPEDYKQEVM